MLLTLLIAPFIVLGTFPLNEKDVMSRLEYIHSKRAHLSVSDVIEAAFLRSSLTNSKPVSAAGLLGDLRQYSSSLGDMLIQESFKVDQISTSLFVDAGVPFSSLYPAELDSDLDDHLPSLSKFTSLALQSVISTRRLLVWTQIMQLHLSNLLASSAEQPNHKALLLLDLLASVEATLFTNLLSKHQYGLAQAAVSTVSSRVTLAFSKVTLDEWMVRLADVAETPAVSALKTTLRKLIADDKAYAGQAFDNQSLMDLEVQVEELASFFKTGEQDPLSYAEEDAIVETVSLWMAYAQRVNSENDLSSSAKAALNNLFSVQALPLFVRQRERLEIASVTPETPEGFKALYRPAVADVVNFISQLAAAYHSGSDESVLLDLSGKAGFASEVVCASVTDLYNPVNILRRVESEMQFAISLPLMEEWLTSLSYVLSSRSLDEKLARHAEALEEIIKTPAFILELQSNIHSLVDIEEKLRQASIFINSELFMSNKVEALAGNLVVWRAHLFRVDSRRLDNTRLLNACTRTVHHVVLSQRRSMGLPVLPMKSSDWTSIEEYQEKFPLEDGHHLFQKKYLTREEVNLVEWRSELTGYAAQFDGLQEMPADLMESYRLWTVAASRQEASASASLVSNVEDLFKQGATLQDMLHKRKRQAVLRGLVDKAEASGLSYVLAGKDKEDIVHVGSACPTAVLKQLETQIEAFVSRPIIQKWVEKMRITLQGTLDDFQSLCGRQILRKIQSDEWYAEQKERIYSIENLPRKLETAISFLKSANKDGQLAMDALLGNLFIWRAHLVRLESEGRLDEVEGGDALLAAVTADLLPAINEQLLIQRELLGLLDQRTPKKQSLKVDEAKMASLVNRWDGLRLIYSDRYDEDEVVLVILASNLAALKLYNGRNAAYLTELEAQRKLKEIEISTRLLQKY